MCTPTPCPENCKHCHISADNTLICTDCSVGFYLDLITGICIICEGCTFC